MVVTGHVQGVGFRWATRAAAQEFGVTGFAVNQSDGSVLVEAQGATVAVDSLRAWLSHGPPSASVEAVTASSVPLVVDEVGFAVG
jgi:acylphosphatase